MGRNLWKVYDKQEAETLKHVSKRHPERIAKRVARKAAKEPLWLEVMRRVGDDVHWDVIWVDLVNIVMEEYWSPTEE